MGLMSDLGYKPKQANAVQRGIQRVTSTRAVGWLSQRTLYPMDKMFYKATSGRATVTSLLAGLPVIMLTSTGAKSGKPRSMPLIGFPTGDALMVVGTNFGQKPTPGWVYNLRADPTAHVGYRDRDVAVVARRADETETDEAFRLAAKVYPGYAEYRTRAGDREINAFVLETADNESTEPF